MSLGQRENEFAEREGSVFQMSGGGEWGWWVIN